MVFKIISFFCIGFVAIQLVFLVLILILEKTTEKKDEKRRPLCVLTLEPCEHDTPGECSDCKVPEEYYGEKEERRRD